MHTLRTHMLRACLLPRGTNAHKVDVNLSEKPREELPNSRPARAHAPAQKTRGEFYDLTPETRLPNEGDHSPEYAEAIRRSMVGLPNHAPTQAARLSQTYQSIQGQAQGVERHMNLMKPVKRPFKTAEQLGVKKREPTPIKKVRTSKSKSKSNLARLRADRALRDRIQQLVNSGECE